MSYLKDREIWLSSVPTGNPPAGYVWVFIQNGVFVVRDSNGVDKIMATTTGTVTNATSASYVEYSNVASKPALISGSSQVSYTGLSNTPAGIVSGSTQVSFNGITDKPALVSSSAQIVGYGVFATTGSNQFNGSQAITGSLTVTGQVVAQTLNVQQVTSSIVYSSGSNIFGNSLGNTQQFTGSVSVTGSLAITGVLNGTSGTFSQTEAVPLTVVRTSTNSNVGIRYQNNTTSWYAGQASDGAFAISFNAADLSSGQFKLTSAGAATFASSGSFGGGTLNGANFIIKGQNGVPATSGTITTAVFRVSSGTGLYNVLDFGTNESLDYSWIQSTRANSLGTYDYLAIQPNGGNLLVGTLTNAGYKLDVNGTGRFSGSLGIGGATSTNGFLEVFKSGGSIAQFSIGQNSTYHTDFFVDASGNFYLQPQGNTALTIASTGAATFSSSVTALNATFKNQGSAPNNTLFVQTSDYASGSVGSVLRLGHIATTGITTAIIQNLTSGGTAAGNISFPEGNVGIGTASPDQLLQVAGNISLGRFNVGSSKYVGLTNGGGGFGDSSGSHIEFTSSSSTNGINFYTYNGTTYSEKMRITSAGDVCIGITSALQPSANRGSLSINGVSSSILSFGVGSATKAYLYTGGTTLTIESVGASADIIFATGNADRLRITSSGILTSLPTYNNTTASAANVQIDSNGYFARSTSSLKYKTDIRNYTKGLNEVLGLRPVFYKGKTDGDTQFAGLIAEEVHELGLTEFVQYAPDGSPDALSYQNMVALLIKSIQELKSENDNLKSRLEVLEQA